MEKIMCFECGAVNDYEIKNSIRIYNGDGYNFTLTVKVPFCKKCGAHITVESIEEEIDKQAHRKILEYRTSKLK